MPSRHRAVDREGANGGNAGFTLVQLIAVLAVLAVLSVLAVSRGLSPSGFQPRVAAGKLVADLQYAQQLAMTGSQRHGIAFDKSQNRYTVFSGTPATPVTSPAGQTPFIVQYGQAPLSHVVLSSVDFDGTNVLYFNSQGRPLGGSGGGLASDGTIVLNSSVTVTIVRETGYARIS